MKVFKILNPKRAGSTGDTDSARGIVNAYGNKNLKAMIDETQKKIEGMTSEELSKSINQMIQALEQIKNGQR